MRTTSILGVVAILTGLTGLTGALAGCDARSARGPAVPAGTTVTAADISSAGAADATEASAASAAPAPREESPAPEALPGQLVCKTKTLIAGTTELFLVWSGDVATGSLRQSAPSGMVYVQPVRAERGNGLIIVDPPESIDLVSHAAVLGKQNGKQFIRVGDPGQPWTACE